MTMEEYEKVQELKQQGYTQDQTVFKVLGERAIVSSIMKNLSERKK